MIIRLVSFINVSVSTKRLANPVVSLLLLNRLEFILALAAAWALPILRKILELCSRLYAMLGIAFLRIIYIAAFGALVFSISDWFHHRSP
jgi:hypothetical protein